MYNAYDKLNDRNSLWDISKQPNPIKWEYVELESSVPGPLGYAPNGPPLPCLWPILYSHRAIERVVVAPGPLGLTQAKHTHATHESASYGHKSTPVDQLGQVNLVCHILAVAKF